MKVPRRKHHGLRFSKRFSTSRPRLDVRSLEELPSRIRPSYHGSSVFEKLHEDKLTSTETKGYDLLSLHWPSPPRNILLVKKENATTTTEAVLQFARYMPVEVHLSPLCIH